VSDVRLSVPRLLLQQRYCSVMHVLTSLTGGIGCACSSRQRSLRLDKSFMQAAMGQSLTRPVYVSAYLSEGRYTYFIIFLSFSASPHF